MPALLTGLAAAALCGALLALGGKFAGLFLLALLLCGGMLFLPWPWLLAAQLATVFVLIGPLQYVAGVHKAFWLPYLMAVVMGVRFLLDLGLNRLASAADPSAAREPAARATVDRWVGCGLALMALYALSLTASSLAARATPMQALVGGKDLLFLWSLPAALGVGLLGLRQLESAWRWITAWLALQVLVVAWQRLVVAPRRGGDSPWDAVVGLFAGSAFSGGGSGTMALVSLWAAAVVIMGWQAGRAGGRWALLALGCALLCCLMAEVKIAALVLPLLAVLILALPGGGNRLRLGWMPVAALAFSALLAWSYQVQFTSARSEEGHSALRYAQTTLARNLDTTVQADGYGQLTRLGALLHWWQRQSAVNIPGWLIGHGIGSVRNLKWAEGESARHDRFSAARSSAAILLWESGVLGLLGWCGATAAWMVAAWQLARKRGHEGQSWLLSAAFCMMALTLLSLPYGADLFEAPHLPTAYLLAVGVVLAAAREQRLLAWSPAP